RCASAAAWAPPGCSRSIDPSCPRMRASTSFSPRVSKQDVDGRDTPGHDERRADAMDLRFTAEEVAFRDEVRAFMRESLPATIRRKMVEGRRLVKDDIVTWQRILNAKGWAVPHWPVEWGGTGWTPVQQYIFRDELQQAPAPEPLQFGTTMVGPV